MNEEQPKPVESLGYASLEDLVSSKLGLKTTAARECLTVALDNILLIDKKNQAYGPNNIGKHGLQGIVVRMDDKFERLATMFKNRKRSIANESVRDTLKDISNYAIIALVFDSGKWPKE